MKFFTSHQLKFSATVTRHSLPSLLLGARRQSLFSDHLLVPGAFPSHNYTCETPSSVSSFLLHRICQGPFLYSLLGSSCTFLEHCSRRKSCEMQIPRLQQHRDNYKSLYEVVQGWSISMADLKLYLQRDVERVLITGNTLCAIKWISRFNNSIPGVVLVLQTNPPKVPGSKEWKTMKNCSGRTKKSQYHLQKGSVLSCAPLHSHKWGGLVGWAREQPSGRAGKQDFGRKEESWHSKKAQLKYPHPSNNFCGPRTTPLAATFMSCEVGFPASSFWLLYGDKSALL